LECYDLVLIDVFDANQGPSLLYSNEVTVIVDYPKQVGDGVQSRARVVEVLLGEQESAVLPEELIEPSITGNGKLMVAQVGEGDLKYSYSDTPCDIQQLKDFKHISEFYSEAQLNPGLGAFGIAKYPIRDMEGRPLVSGERVRGAYPWIDRDGDNIMFIQGKQDLYFVDPGRPATELAGQRYEVLGGTPGLSSPTPASELYPLNDAVSVGAVTQGNPKIGMTFFGLWTKGRMISPDTRNNNVDMAMGGGFRLLNLYSDDDPVLGTLVGGAAKEFINSTENQFESLLNLRPATPRDVVWLLSSNHDTAEYAFDDVLDPQALLISEMTPTINHGSASQSRFSDGFEFVTGGGVGFTSPARLANHATSTDWVLPAYGLLLGGSRAEPIAAGGEKGKGLWCDGVDDRLEFLVPEQSGSMEQDWFFSVAINPRGSSPQRRLLTLPNGTWLDVVSSTTIQIGGSTGSPVDISIPAELALGGDHWTTISIASAAAGGADVRLYLNGYLLDELSAPSFQMSPGRLTLCGADSGFRGWVDNFKVIGRHPSPEVVCNHAGGTMVGLLPGDGSNPDLQGLASIASEYSLHGYFSTTGFGEFACERPGVQSATGVCLGRTRRLANYQYADRCVRQELLLGPVPFYWDAPRHDLTANGFCTSCHGDSNASATLTTDALLVGSVDFADDQRRQPSQAPPKLFGMVPSHYLVEELPPQPPVTISTPPTGWPIDEYLMPEEP
jgi:hypothetical protein